MKEGEELDRLISYYVENIHKLEQFKASVETLFQKDPSLHDSHRPIVHSIKSRIKSPDHLRDKICRKTIDEKLTIDSSNLFSMITDLIGVRVLHLYQDQFPRIHGVIQKQVEEGEWCYVEEPKAYSWDPETKNMYDSLGLNSEIKESYYTSVHYLIKPNNSNPNPVCCEIQVRTLFEEIWGEISHSINYPIQTESIACKEQLKVLSKLVSTGTRLADSIFRSHCEWEQSSKSEKNNTIGNFYQKKI